MKRVLYFTKPCRPYNSGEIAGFDERDAARLIALGVAIPNEETVEGFKPPEWRSPPEVKPPPKKKPPKKKAAKKAAKKK